MNTDTFWLSCNKEIILEPEINLYSIIITCNIFNNKTYNSYNIKLKIYFVEIKKFFILEQIREVFGGSIGYRKSQDTFYYSSVSFGSAKKVINYFDHFNLLSSKHINFLKWRKVYRLIQKKKHLTENGINLILKIKSTMNSL